MNENKEQEQLETIEFDPEEIHEGACQIRKFGEGKVAVCKENKKIKIFEVEKED